MQDFNVEEFETRLVGKTQKQANVEIVNEINNLRNEAERLKLFPDKQSQLKSQQFRDWSDQLTKYLPGDGLSNEPYVIP